MHCKYLPGAFTQRMHYQPHPGRSRGGAGSSTWHNPSKDLFPAKESQSCFKGGPASSKSGVTKSTTASAGPWTERTKSQSRVWRGKRLSPDGHLPLKHPLVPSEVILPFTLNSMLHAMVTGSAVAGELRALKRTKSQFARSTVFLQRLNTAL